MAVYTGAMSLTTRRPLYLRTSVIWAGLTLLLIIVLVAGYFWLNRSDDMQPPSPTNSSTSVSQPVVTPTIRIAAMGDMIPHDTITDGARTADGYDYGQYFQHIRGLYRDADVVFCNQEGPSAGDTYGITGYPSFNAPLEFAHGLQSGAGCTLVNLANNHIADKGVEALGDTVQLWRDKESSIAAGANLSGEEQRQVAYMTVKDVRIAFLAFADFNNVRTTPTHAVNLYHDEALVRELATEARANSDVVIVSMHWGDEDSADINDDQRRLIELLASLGVDVIIGTGPHVLQSVETITRPDGKPMLVWYSLGNMLSSQLGAPQLFSGVALFDITKFSEDEHRIENVAFAPTYMHYDWPAASRGNLRARTNPIIYPLSQAAEPLANSHLNTTIDEQRAYMTRVLGPEVTIK